MVDTMFLNTHTHRNPNIRTRTQVLIFETKLLSTETGGGYREQIHLHVYMGTSGINKLCQYVSKIGLWNTVRTYVV